MFFWALVALNLCTAATASQNGPSPTCSNGLCIATVEATDTQLGATIALKGSPEAFAALDHEGGWEVWDCDPDTEVMDQTISIACSNPEGCGDLYSGGAIGTIVKLDKRCTNSEFGVVVAEERAEDQFVPHEVARRLVKRGVETPEVRKVTLKELSEVDGRHGNVTFFVFGSTWGNEPDETRATGSGGKHDYFDEVSRGILGITEQLHHQPIARRGDVLAPFGTPSFGQAKVPIVPWATDQNRSFPISVNTSVELFERNLFCQKYARARIGVTAKAAVLGKIDIGVVASGVVWPPVVTKFKLFTNVTANVEAHLKLGLSVEGTIASGDITLFEIGVPGLNFPGILNVGPAFRIVANAGATLALDMDVDVALKYGLPHWVNTYPSEAFRSPELVPQETDNPLTLAVSEHVEAYGVVEGHIVAKLEVSIDAFKSKARAAVYFGLDAYARAKASVKHNGRYMDVDIAEEPSPEPKSIAGRLSVPDTRELVDTKDNEDILQAIRRRELIERGRQWVETNNSICASLALGLNAHLGAEGNLFDIITARARLILWGHEWSLYKKCAEEIPDYIAMPLDLQCGGGEYDPWTGKCIPRSGGGLSWGRREVAQPNRAPAPIKCPAAGPVGAVTQLFQDSFKPLTAAVLPNAAS